MFSVETSTDLAVKHLYETASLDLFIYLFLRKNM